MNALTISALAVILTSLSVQAQETNSLSCLCKCACPDSTGTNCLCPCACDVPKTVCFPGFAKVCPQKVDGCPNGETTFCEKDARQGARNIKKWLKGNGIEESRQSEISAETRGKSDILKEVHCKDGKTPKFKCVFKIDYEPYGSVTKFSPTECTHRKNFESCPVEIETDEGCTISTKLKNKKNKVYTVGKIKLKCPPTTPNPTATTAITTAPPTTTTDPYGHAGENVTVIGDGCSCVPEFFMALGTTNPSGVPTDRKGNQPEEPPANMKLIRNNFKQEVRCLGVPRFTCTFIFDTDEYCEHAFNIEARKCNHRRQVTQCPIELTTDIGCKLDLIITNIGDKMKVAKNYEIAGGLTRTKGFLENCVCIAPGAM